MVGKSYTKAESSFQGKSTRRDHQWMAAPMNPTQKQSIQHILNAWDDWFMDSHPCSHSDNSDDHADNSGNHTTHSS